MLVRIVRFDGAVVSGSRDSKSAIEELEEREKERDGFYAANRAEMEEFKERQRRFVSDTREEVRKLRDWVSEVRFFCSSVSNPRILVGCFSSHSIPFLRFCTCRVNRLGIRLHYQ